MRVKEILEILHAAPMSSFDEERMEKDYTAAFATDLMSDALAMIQSDPESTVLLTGLANVQTLRTAEMLDIDFIVFVRGKYLHDETIDMAKEMGICALATDYTMYEACGLLYEKGLGGIYGKRTA